jgi:hypothetical protein
VPTLERLPIDEALRSGGMDERAYAKALARFMARVASANRDAKLMLDGLKEWSRHFQPKRSAESAPANDPPVIVQLVHDVRRPVRPPLEIPLLPPTTTDA